MKILFVTNLYPTKENPDYGVFTKDQIENTFQNGVIGDVLFINAREKGIGEYFKAIKRINKIYTDYDLIHCFHGLSLIATVLASKNKPILISFLLPIKLESLHKNKLISELYSLTYSTIIKFKRVFSIFKDKVPEHLILNDRTYYLPNGVDLSAFYPINREAACKALSLDPSKSYIMFVSSKEKFRPVKRYDLFSKTIKILKNNSKGLDIEELVMSSVPREQCIYYFNAASVHLLTSDYEGSPNSVKEAMSCNTPVVSTDVGNVKQMFIGANNCYISPQEPTILADYVLKAIIDPPCDLRNVLIENKLTVQDKTNELIDIYRTIIGKQIDIKI
jgi:teichuronic acid biosynthesis glycosyltransferase TuaC